MDRVGKTDHDSKWKSLWHSDDDNGNTNDDVSKPLLDVLREFAVTLESLLAVGDTGVGGQFSSHEIELSSDHSFDEVSQKEGVEDEDSSVHTELTNISGDDLKFHLEWGCLIGLLLNGGHDLTLASHLSDNDADEPSLSSLDLGSGKQNWRWDVMGSLSVLIVDVVLVLLLSLLALVVGFLWQVI